MLFATSIRWQRSLQKAVLLLFVVFLSQCAELKTDTYTDRIDPLLSLDGSDANPTIYMPFGMVQLTPITSFQSPDSNQPGKYVADKKTFLGFEHFNHLRTHAVANHPDIRIGFELASTKNLSPTFDQSTELAAVGRYAVLSEFPTSAKSVRTEAAVGQFTSLVEFIFPENEQNAITLGVLASENTNWQISRADSFYVKIDVLESQQPLHALVRLSMFPDSVTVGNIKLANNDTLSFNTSQNSLIKAHYTSTDKRKQVMVNSGFSRISSARTESNFELDSQGWWLEGMVAKTKLSWRTHLSKLNIVGGTLSDQINFYTLHYRLLKSLAILTESAGQFPVATLNSNGQDVNTDRYAWYGELPSWERLFWLRSTEAVPIKQLGEDLSNQATRFPIPKSFYQIAVNLEELEGVDKSLDNMQFGQENSTSLKLLQLSGLEISDYEKPLVTFKQTPFTNFSIHLGGNAYYRRYENTSKQANNTALELLNWFDNGFSY